MRFAGMVAIIAGCGSSNSVVISHSRADTPGPVEKLAVFVALPSNGNQGLYYGLKKALPGELAACSVDATVVPGMPDDTDAPSDRLIVRATDGLLSTVTTVDRAGNVLDNKAFKEMDLDLVIELHDLEQDRATWLASANVHMKSPGPSTGEDLAHALVARLRADGVLSRCR